jgi:hypothetical protein
VSRARPAAGSFWPTPRQRLLLRAALWQGERAAAAWRQVRPSLDLDVLEPGSIVLTPLIYRKLVELGIDDPDLQRLKGLYRRAWYENQLLVEQLDRQLAALAEAGVESLVLAGPPLVLRFYGDLGLRRLSSLDLLVREHALATAADALCGIGMVEQPRAGNADAPRAFRSDRGHVCLLRGGPPRDLLLPDGDGADDLWRSAVDVPIGTGRCRAAAPTEELLLTCLTGAKPAVEHRVDWLLDAATIVDSTGDGIEWERLRAEAARRAMSPRLRDALGFLRRELEAAVPEQLLAELELTPLPRAERLAHRLSAASGGVVGGFPDTVATHLRLCGERGLPHALATLPRFLERTWGLEHAWQMAPRAAEKLARQTAATVRRALRRGPGRRRRAAAARRRPQRQGTAKPGVGERSPTRV